MPVTRGDASPWGMELRGLSLPNSSTNDAGKQPANGLPRYVRSSSCSCKQRCVSGGPWREEEDERKEKDSSFQARSYRDELHILNPVSQLQV